MKPELIILSASVLLVLTGTATAADMISHRAIMGYITTEIEWLFKAALWIGVVVSCALVAWADPENKAKAFKRLGICIAALIAFYVVPGIMSDIDDMSIATNNTNT